eukprot:CAMPEP_0170640372 /NCGR_PEP_ID=MMETSP0224-20130122/40190_1 /TAXON_ID=285029 /ORGANISM="Togula jolla, Strain CCCM 725" /LENGTH=238 /DNA_ID=CAMNT_0010970875 /DNA_START=1 /DNA_END=714 /DNA_ORIENTATION=-
MRRASVASDAEETVRASTGDPTRSRGSLHVAGVEKTPQRAPLPRPRAQSSSGSGHEPRESGRASVTSPGFLRQGGGSLAVARRATSLSSAGGAGGRGRSISPAGTPKCQGGLSPAAHAAAMLDLRTGSSEASSGPQGPGRISHQDAIRARRTTLEKARQKGLQRALSKQGMTRPEEIVYLERQLGEGCLSEAALIGVQKRIATLRAAQLREERAAAAAGFAGHEEAIPVTRNRAANSG